jgi:hypothetical protein
MAVANEIRNPERDDPRLPRARARQDQQRTVTVQDGFFLRRVELFEEVHGGMSIIASGLWLLAAGSSRTDTPGVVSFSHESKRACAIHRHAARASPVIVICRRLRERSSPCSNMPV